MGAKKRCSRKWGGLEKKWQGSFSPLIIADGGSSPPIYPLRKAGTVLSDSPVKIKSKPSRSVPSGSPVACDPPARKRASFPKPLRNRSISSLTWKSWGVIKEKQTPLVPAAAFLSISSVEPAIRTRKFFVKPSPSRHPRSAGSVYRFARVLRKIKKGLSFFGGSIILLYSFVSDLSKEN